MFDALLRNTRLRKLGYKLEIAKQYPDINIGPGYTYEETHSFFTVASRPLFPLFNRNHGPIAEAEALARKPQLVFERQAQVIARVSGRRRLHGGAERMAEAESFAQIYKDATPNHAAAIRALRRSTQLSLDNVETKVGS